MEIKSHSHSLTSRRGKKNYVVDQLLVCLGGSVHIQFARQAPGTSSAKWTSNWSQSPPTRADHQCIRVARNGNGGDKEQRHGGDGSGSSLVGHLFLVCWSWKSSSIGACMSQERNLKLLIRLDYSVTRSHSRGRCLPSNLKKKILVDIYKFKKYRYAKVPTLIFVLNPHLCFRKKN